MGPLRQSGSRQASLVRYRSAFDYAVIGMALVAPDGRWLRVNPAFCAMTGYTAPELLGMTFQQMTHADDQEAVRAALQRLLAQELATFQTEKRYFRKDGRLLWTLWSASLFRDVTGKALYFIAQIQDISDRKAVEKEREYLIQQLREALAKVKTLQGLLPVCAWCKNIRNDQGYWKSLETFLAEHLDVSFTHGICMDCLQKVKAQADELRERIT